MSRRLPPIIAATALLVSSSCSDSTAPERPTQVTVTLSQLEGPVYSEVWDPEPFIRCVPHFVASNTGPRGVNMGAITARFYIGANRSMPIDSVTIPAADAMQFWSNPHINPGGTSETALLIEAAIPFSMELDFGYVPDAAGARYSRASVTCGPEVPPNAPAPVVTSAVIVTQGEIEPGDFMEIEYAATSAVGLWSTSVSVSGPCSFSRVVRNRGEKTVSARTALQVPRECQLGVPMIVSVGAVDAALHESMLSSSTGRVIVDRTPPDLGVFRGRSFNYESLGLAGDLFPGDTLWLYANVVENGMMATLSWQRMSGGTITTIPYRADWQPIVFGDDTGDLGLRVWVTDAAGNQSVPYETPAGALMGYPLRSRPVVSRRIDGEIRELAVDAPHDRAYALVGNKVLVLSATTLDQITTIQLPYFGSGLDITRGGDSLVVSVDQQPSPLLVVDLTATPQAISAPIITGPAGEPLPAAQLATSMANDHVLMSALGGLFDVDLTTGHFTTVLSGYGFVAARSGDHASALIDMVENGAYCGRRYDIVNGLATSCGANWGQARGSADMTGTNFAIFRDIYQDNARFVRRLRVPDTSYEAYYGFASQLSPDGAYLYIWGVKGLFRSAVSDGRIVDLQRTPDLQGVWQQFMRGGSDGAIFMVTSEPGTTRYTITRFAP